MNNQNEPVTDKFRTARRHSCFKLFALGFIGGTLAATLYVVFLEDHMGREWAEIMFYPGFCSGLFFYNNVTSDEFWCRIVGCLTVGITYGMAVVIIVALKRRFASLMHHEKS